MLECHFCESMTWDLRTHVLRGCPAHFLAVQGAALSMLQSAELRHQGVLRGHQEYWDREGKLSLRLHHDLHVWTALPLEPGTHQLISTTGVWQVWDDPEIKGQSAQVRRVITRQVVQAMASGGHTLEHIQRRWNDMTLSHIPPSHAVMSPVTILHPHSQHLPISTSIALGWTLHGLDEWRLVSTHSPTIILPDGPQPGARQTTLVLCTGDDHHHHLVQYGPVRL
mmetsp:Transcript_79926/g.141122  ORF Transcript_79926/g.141122 Transcript_79926/m.141122 type:complete len:224 (+) Transcript_79926:433-1104(+)